MSLQILWNSKSEKWKSPNYKEEEDDDDESQIVSTRSLNLEDTSTHVILWMLDTSSKSRLTCEWRSLCTSIRSVGLKPAIKVGPL